jgi:hypothetical protein
MRGGLRREGSFLRPSGHDSASPKSDSRQASYQGSRSLRSRPALAHEFRHPRTLWGLADRLLDHPFAPAGKHRSTADSAGCPWCECHRRSSGGDRGVAPGRIPDLGVWGQRRRRGSPSLPPKANRQTHVRLGQEEWHPWSCCRRYAPTTVSAHAFSRGCGRIRRFQEAIPAVFRAGPGIALFTGSLVGKYLWPGAGSCLPPVSLRMEHDDPLDLSVLISGRHLVRDMEVPARPPATRRRPGCWRSLNRLRKNAPKQRARRSMVYLCLDNSLRLVGLSSRCVVFCSL